MSYRRLFRLAASLVLLAFAGMAFAAASGLRFHAVLSGAQEVPAVDTASSARALVFFDRAFTQVHVRIDLQGDLMVAGAHFHCGQAGVNGPVAFGILNPGPLLEVGDHTRVTLTNQAFTGEDCASVVGRPVNNIAALAFAMRDGLVYVNLHTPTEPTGEVRGQLVEF